MPVPKRTRPRRNLRPIDRHEALCGDSLNKVKDDIAELKARIWKAPVTAFSGGAEEKRQAHNALKVAAMEVAEARKHLSHATSEYRRILRRCK